uniref:Reverse transcriptase domain-containing protein n=1 Tax=Astyanax mexicanus TaxID=7994 RepID=A0A3B1JAG4_ASTMX
MFSRTSSTSPCAAPLSQRASIPPPLSPCRRSPQCPASMTTVPLHLHPSSEVLRKASHEEHQDTTALFTGPPAVCVSSQSLHGRCHHHYSSSLPHPPGEEGHLRQNAVHRLQFSIQHHHPTEPHQEAKLARPQHPPLQLDPGLSDGETPVSPVRGQHLQHHHTEHGAPQGSVLSPLLFTLLTHDCAAKHSSNSFIKFADDTTVLGLITKGDESANREEVQRLTDWCTVNNLHLNVDKTKEMVVDFRRAQHTHSPLNIDGSSVEIVKSTKFLGVHLADNLTWTLNTSSTAKKAQQRLYFLRKLRKARLPPPILTLFYRGTIESILSSCITAWFGTCTVSDCKTLQRIVRTAERIIGVSLPSITDIYTTRSIRKATSIVNDPTHPSHELFSLLPSGRRYRSIRSSTTRFCNSFYPQAIRLLNCRD